MYQILMSWSTFALEANKSHFILHDVVGIDVGFENPMFACLEVDYSDADEDSTGEALQETEKVLTYYELDLGLKSIFSPME